MGIFDIFKKKNTESMEQILNKVDSKNLIRRYALLIFALFLSALSYNLFFVSGKIVVGGVSGVAIIIDELTNLNPSVFILIVNVFLIILSFIFLGTKTTLKTIVGALAYPLFVSLTSNITNYIDLSNADLLIKTLFGAVLSGTASGLVFKSGFTSGGTDILIQIMSKYSKVSVGKASLSINIIIIGGSGFFFGWINVMYAVIAIYLISVMTDKVLLGISDNKAFFIITSKEEEIKEFIIDNLRHSVTILKSQGGFTNKQKNVLMVVIPTKEYFVLKESIHEIDNDAFFVVTDSYQVSGGE